MTKLVLISHGRFSEELKRSVEMIMGPQKDITTVGLLPDEGPDDFKEKLEQALGSENNAVVFADLLGGTPCNVAAGLLMAHTHEFKLYAGMNMPMIVGFLNAEMTNGELNPTSDGQQGVVDVNAMIG